MYEQILEILQYIVDSFIHIWPYLLITIPIAVAVQMSGASNYISRAFTARPLIAIILATAVGAFSPLCSCSVIPVVAAMLIGGVPLAPVMSFWLASPSMDPEIFFLTVGSLGWELAVWRLASTLILSLAGGFITHALVQTGWLGSDILRKVRSTKVLTLPEILKLGIRNISRNLRLPNFRYGMAVPAQPVEVGISGEACCDDVDDSVIRFDTIAMADSRSFSGSHDESIQTSSCSDDACGIEEKSEQPSFWNRLARETWEATTMVIKFMLLAWLIGAIVKLYVPEAWIVSVLGSKNPWSIFTAALLGVPVYTSNLAAMPLVGGLLTQGMQPAAALAFLIAGPMTTLPAMSAVFGLVNRKVFSIYIGFALVGAVLLGYAYVLVLRL